MIENLSFKVAKQINKQDPSSNINELAEGLAVIINNTLVIVLSLGIASILGKPTETFISMMAFVLLRYFSGGAHAPSLEWCVFISTSLFVIIPFISIGDRLILLINIASMVLLSIYAPTNKKGNSKRQIYRDKMFSILVVSINLVLNSPVIALTFLVQALLCIPLLTERSENDEYN